MLHPTTPSRPNTHTRSPPSFWATQAEEKAAKNTRGNSHSPCSLLPSAQRPRSKLGCPWRARTGCLGRPHPPAGSLWGIMSEGSCWGSRKGRAQDGTVPQASKSTTEAGMQLRLPGRLGQVRGGGGAGAGPRLFVHLAPAWGWPLPRGPRLTRPSAVRPGPQGRRRACPCRCSGPGSSHRPCPSP